MNGDGGLREGVCEVCDEWKPLVPDVMLATTAFADVCIDCSLNLSSLDWDVREAQGQKRAPCPTCGHYVWLSPNGEVLGQ